MNHIAASDPYRQGVSTPTRAKPERFSAGSVRPFERRDMERVAEMHERIMQQKNSTPPAILRANLERILLQHPSRIESLPSLVYEDIDGKIIGFLGVFPHSMQLRGRPVMAAVSHSFMVEPGNRSSLAALELARTFLTGPQDLSLAEGNNASRRIWELAGGRVALLYSLCWTRPLQPSRYVLSFLKKRGLPAIAGWALPPLCQVADTIAALLTVAFRQPRSATVEMPLDGSALCKGVADFIQQRPLSPHYNEYTGDWLLETLAQIRGRGRFHSVHVQNDRRETIGWYLYYGSRGKIGAVVQIGAKAGAADEVVDSLFRHARQNGLIALSGQVDPDLFRVMASRNCLFHHDGRAWILMHSKRPELLQAIHQGDAYMTRLDGEWWISSLLG